MRTRVLVEESIHAALAVLGPPTPARVSAALDHRRHLFINTDLSVHLIRPASGEWVCLEATTFVDGLGLADTVLWDERGRLGRCAQTLLIRERK